MDDWLYTINSCLTSSYMCSRFAVPEMVKAGGGAIVNISSRAGRRGLPYRVGYCSAKAGQIGMTYGMALELAPAQHPRERVAPGAVEGDRIDRVIQGQAEVRGIELEAMRKTLSSARRSGGWRPPTTSSAAAVFLCSDGAQHLGPGAPGQRRRAGRVDRRPAQREDTAMGPRSDGGTDRTGL